MTRPVRLHFDGEVFRPTGDYHRQLAARSYEVGGFYVMAPFEQRSDATHRHQFAWLREAFNSLPERYAVEPWATSPEHLRKHALIRTGFCDVETVVAGSKAAALRFAAMLRGIDEYALVTVDGATVTRLTAQSQSQRAMGKARFQESKTAILEFIADLIGVTPEDLQRQEDAA